MDATRIGIVTGLALCILYALVRSWRQRSFDIGALLLMFLAGFSVPGGALLIDAALSGNANALPSTWREYVTVAGIAAIALSLQYIVQAFRNAWARRASAASADDGGSSTQMGIR